MLFPEVELWSREQSSFSIFFLIFLIGHLASQNGRILQEVEVSLTEESHLNILNFGKILPKLTPFLESGSKKWTAPRFRSIFYASSKCWLVANFSFYWLCLIQRQKACASNTWFIWQRFYKNFESVLKCTSYVGDRALKNISLSSVNTSGWIVLKGNKRNILNWFRPRWTGNMFR